VAPTNVAAGAATDTSVTLSWTPIAYTADTGGYRADFSQAAGGPYTTGPITANKSAASITVTGLNAGTTYHFVVRTVTNPCSSNPNTVTSDPSAEVSATTTGAAAGFIITTPSPLPDGVAGSPYALRFTSSGGVGAVTWSVASGSLDGLGVSTAGVLSGTPAAGGDFSAAVRAADSGGHTAQGTFSLHVATSAADEYTSWVPVASHNGGKNGSLWRSDLGILNPGAVLAHVQLRFHGTGGVVTSAQLISAGVQAILTDVVGQIGGSNSGPIEVVSDQPLILTARTYNLVSATAACYPSGTQGQNYPQLEAENGLTSRQVAFLAGLSETTGHYHCNIGLVNVSAAAASVLVELFDGTGAKLIDYVVALNSGEWKQETQPFLTKAAQTAMERGFARVTVLSGSGVFAFASVVDGATNDPTTIAMHP